MGEKEAKFRSEIKKGTLDDNSMTDGRIEQQHRANIIKTARIVYGHYTPTVSEEEQGSYECDRDGE